jgi:hypothetical protein
MNMVASETRPVSVSSNGYLRAKKGRPPLAFMGQQLRRCYVYLSIERIRRQLSYDETTAANTFSVSFQYFICWNANNASLWGRHIETQVQAHACRFQLNIALWRCNGRAENHPAPAGAPYNHPDEIPASVGKACPSSSPRPIRNSENYTYEPGVWH